ncbi:hypothetical protein [Butyrivibrio sp. AE2032]|uniref:hypothetical protein n=1 Tax=Butyrivibrio sp. AE2032 TaxID=1458463 RepID=UPI00055186E0|nr:hypothetical protein [Butyrivibrio sp. AE2032]
MKRFEITYNPYSNRIHFRVAIPIDEEHVSEWCELQAESCFMEYQNSEIVFENDISRILVLINKYINTTEFLEIVFRGTAEDFETLQNTVFACRESNAKRITCTHAEVYLSSAIALERLKKAFSKVENDFKYYFVNYPYDNGIMDLYIRYKDVVKPEIPVCLIGLRDVGKTNLLNAFIGVEVIPNQSNGISVVVRNDKEYRIIFNYKKELYVITIEGNKYSVKIPTKPNDKMISALFLECDSCADEKEIMHTVLQRIFNGFSETVISEEFEGCVSVFIPFRESLLNTTNYSFSFIDTTVRFLDEKEDFKIVYDDVVLRQTNALPVILVTRDVLFFDELFDLKRLIDELGAGFARPYSIIILSESDELFPSEIKNDIPDNVRERIDNPTILYVSPDYALGAIKDDSTEENADVNEFIKTNPSQDNIIPRVQVDYQSDKSGASKLLCASGIPSFEFELNHYATQFANYKKCANGQLYLIDSINKLVKELKNYSMQFDKELKQIRLDREKEQNAIRSDMLVSISKKQKPDFDSAFETVRLQFKPALDEYCAGIPCAVRECWDSVGHRPNNVDNLAKEMRKHCQENLYDSNIDRIKAALQSELLEMTSGYIKNVESYVNSKQNVLSNDGKAALQSIFDKKPHLIDVNIQPCIEVKLKNIIYKYRSDESKINYYIKGFEEQLRPNGDHWGLFYQQCIFDPMRAYSNQLDNWIEQQLIAVRKILGSDHIIVSKFDTRIKELENIITELFQRQYNLTNVKKTLEDLLPQNEFTAMMEE